MAIFCYYNKIQKNMLDMENQFARIPDIAPKNYDFPDKKEARNINGKRIKKIYEKFFPVDLAAGKITNLKNKILGRQTENTGTIIEKEDREAAQSIANAIGAIDNLVFPNLPIEPIHLIRSKNNDKRGPYGYHAPSSDCPEEYYQIFAIGLKEEIEKHLQQKKFLVHEYKKKQWEQLPRIVLNEYLTGIAAHETRHRAQSRENVNLFAPNCKKTCKTTII